MTPRKRELGPAIRRGRVTSLEIYEITAAELDALERGSPESIYLNLAIATLSTFASFLVSLLTTTITSLFLFCSFVIVCMICFLAGLTFSLLWWNSANSLRVVVSEIRRRLPPEGVQEPGAASIDNAE